MAKTKFILEADEARAVHAYLKVVEAQRKATDGQRKVNREGKKGEQVMGGMARSAGTWLASFATIGTVVQGIRSVVSELEKAAQLQKEMHEVALTTEQQVLKIAHLRRDVSPGGISVVTGDVEEVARASSISLDVAAKALFFSESAMDAGTAKAKAAALSIGQFAAPAGLLPEETTLIPKMFDLFGATTGPQQMWMLNQLYAGTASSIAETGEFIKPFITPLVTAEEQGFTFAEALAQMVAAVQTTGSVEKAGTASKRALEIAAGGTKKAIKYYTTEAEKKGLDYSSMFAPERYEFVRELYQEVEAAGPAAMDVFKTTVGGKGFQYMRQMFGEVGQRKYWEVLPQIEAAAGAGYVEQMAAQYKETMTAEATQMGTRGQMAGAETGKKVRPVDVLQEMSEAMRKQVKSLAETKPEIYGLGLTPDKWELHKTARMILLENIERGLELAEPGSKWATELDELGGKIRGRPSGLGGTLPPEITFFKLHPEFVKRAYRATKGFTLVESEGRARGGEGLSEASSAYKRGFEAYYGLEEEVKTTNELLMEIRDAIQGQVNNTTNAGSEAMD